MLNVGLTGNAGAGKSTVARWFASWGATLIEADRLVGELEQPGSPVLEAIVQQFGPEVRRPDGTLDRARLRELAFSDPARRRALEAIVHPAVAQRRAALLAQAAARGDRIVVQEIPLLFEVLDPEEFDLVVLVDAPAELRRARLRQRGLSDVEIDRLFAAQWPAEAKRARSHLVVDNTSSLAELERAARRAWEAILQRAARR